jgi:hypothetical protein
MMVPFVWLGRWSHWAARFFTLTRGYAQGWRWTPFVAVRWRRYATLTEEL